MYKQLLPFRFFAAGALVVGLIALFDSSSTSAKHTQQSAANLVAVTDVSERNVAFVAVDDPEAVYEGARIVHNVTVDGQKGMRVHAKFRVKYGLGVPCTMIAYFFYDDEDTTPLKTDDPKYRSKTNTVSAQKNFTPAYDPAIYEDLQLFVPYDALNVERGETYDLKFYLGLYDKEGGRFFGKSGWYKFKLTMP